MSEDIRSFSTFASLLIIGCVGSVIGVIGFFIVRWIDGG